MKAILTPALANRPGFSGAVSQCISRASETRDALSGMATSGALGKFNGTITGRPVALIASSS